MSKENNFKNLEVLVVSDAERKRDEALAEIEKQKNESICEYIKKSEIKLSDRLLHETGQIENMANERVAEKILENKKQYLTEREKLIEQVFENIVKKLQNYVKTDDYVFSMKAKIENELSHENHDYTVLISSSDEKMLNFAKNTNFNFKIIDKNFIGGCKIVDNTAKTLVDMTFASAVEAEEENFLEKYFKLN